MELGLFVQYKPSLCKDPAYFFPAGLQMVLAFVDQNKVVHIPQIMLDVEMFLDVVIHTVQHGQLHQLAYLGPETYAAISAKAVYDGTYRLSGPAVFDFLAHHSLRCRVRRAVKELADITAQYPAVSSMFTVIPAEMDFHPVKAEIRAFAFKASAVIVDKAFCDLFVKRIIA